MTELMNVEGYERLASVLQRAYDQAARGKGKERHANGKPFHKQPMQDLIRLHGIGFATGQASKKASEAPGLPTMDRQVAELLGAIVYLAGAVISLESTLPESTPNADVPIAHPDRGLDGWIKNTGEFLFPPMLRRGVSVDVMFRCGVKNVNLKPEHLNWSVTGADGDIVAWKFTTDRYGK